MISHAGHTISYDALGNPLNWYSGNKTFSNITWEGRKLTGMTVGSTAYTYSYNSDGIRTKKQNGSNVVEYLYDDAGNLVEEKHSGYSLYFIYDDSNELIGFKVSNGGTYYYGKDVFGVIKYIYNASGTIVGTYTYDAWGNTISSTGTTETNLNPIRYKDYYYDTESGFYYLQSRYYDSQVGRFISADIMLPTTLISKQDYLLSTNLFAYCLNNPINNKDSSGKWLDRLISGVVGATVFGVLAYAICNILKIFVPISSKTTAIITAACATLGGIIGAALGPSFMAKHAPNLLKAIQKIEKTKFSIKAIGPNGGGNIFGIVISNTLIIMLHAPHPKYNEWYFHLQIEANLGGKNIPLCKIPLYNVDKNKWGK